MVSQGMVWKKRHFQGVRGKARPPAGQASSRQKRTSTLETITEQTIAAGQAPTTLAATQAHQQAQRVGLVASWSAGWLVGWSAGWLVGWSAGWPVGQLAWSVSWLVGWLVGWFGWAAGWLAVWLVGWSAGWQVG